MGVGVGVAKTKARASAGPQDCKKPFLPQKKHTSSHKPEAQKGGRFGGGKKLIEKHTKKISK